MDSYISVICGLCFVGLLVLTSCSKENRPVVQDEQSIIEPVFNNKTSAVISLQLTIGDEDIDVIENEEAILGRPQQVQVGNEGDIYISDHHSMQIKIFDKNGKYVRSVGARGEGPGEFKSYTAFGIGYNEEIVIEDELQGRFTVLDSLGKVLLTRETDDNKVLWPRRIIPVEGMNYAMVYKMPNVRPGGIRVEASDHIIHIWSANLQPRERLISKEKFGNMDDRFVDIAAQRNPGSVYYDKEINSYYYAPYLYAGTIYVYTRNDSGGWTEKTIVNREIPLETYESYTPGLEREQYPVRTRFIRSSGEEILGQVFQESLGMFKNENDELVHFILMRSKDNSSEMAPRLVMEVFSSDLARVGMIDVDVLDLQDDLIRLNANPPYEIMAMDSSDRVYVLNRYMSKVHILQISRIEI